MVDEAPPDFGCGLSTLPQPPLSYFCQLPPWLRYTLPSRPAYTSPPAVLPTVDLLPPGPVRVTFDAPLLVVVDRVVAPVLLFVTRLVLAQLSPRWTWVLPQLP